jgi:hypothetical protein
MLALLVSRGDPRGVPLLMIQAGIYPGESDGKDAGFIALRDLLDEAAAPGVLQRMAILFRASLQHRRPRALWPLESPESEPPGRDGLAYNGPEPES